MPNPAQSVGRRPPDEPGAQRMGQPTEEATTTPHTRRRPTTPGPTPTPNGQRESTTSKAADAA
ncbi:MAG: hypothetical protein ACRDYB_15350, partial [Acidimicrobiales bacterium]